MTIEVSESVGLLENLVSTPSPSGQEREASAYLVSWMAAHGFDARLDAVGNAVGSRGDGPRQVLLLGHIDTFPGKLPVRREGDWLYGRGTVDAKGPLCAFAAALAGIAVPSGWQVVVVGAVEEEAATSRGARHLVTQGTAPEACIIGEPSGWDRVTLGYKGRLLAEVQLRAPFAHSAGQARLPAEQAVDLWNAVVAYCDDYNAGRQKAFDRLDPSLRHIVTQDEGAYGSAKMSLGFRLPPGTSPDALADDLRHLNRQVNKSTNRQISSAATEQKSRPISQATNEPRDHITGQSSDQQDSQHGHQGASCRLEFSGEEVAFRAEKNTPLVRAFLSSIRERQGRARFVLKTGTSDMNVVGPAWRCPIVAYGPGDSALDHTPDERISLDEYTRSIEILGSVLETVIRSA
jgi:LysW-gamma-L-lysine carboxypeptidase